MKNLLKVIAIITIISSGLVYLAYAPMSNDDAFDYVINHVDEFTFDRNNDYIYHTSNVSKEAIEAYTVSFSNNYTIMEASDWFFVIKYCNQFDFDLVVDHNFEMVTITVTKGYEDSAKLLSEIGGRIVRDNENIRVFKVITK